MRRGRPGSRSSAAWAIRCRWPPSSTRTFPRRLKNLTNQEVIDSARDLFNGGDWGAFESFGNEYVGEFVYMGKTSNPVQLVAVYEHTTVTFVLAFDGDLQLTEMRVM